MRSLLVGVVAVAACGPGLSEKPAAPTVQEITRPPIRPGVAPPTDEQGIGRLLVADVTNGGLYFDDAACARQFGKPGPVGTDAHDAFAHCLASLQLHPTGRPDSIDDAIILADKNGFEFEAHTVNGTLDFIGFSGRAPGVPDLPSIIPASLEAIRLTGDPNVTLTDEEANRMLSPTAKLPVHEYLRVCIAEDGRVAQLLPGSETHLDSFEAVAAHVRDWRFRSFEVAGKPMPVCALVSIQYPASPRKPDTFPRPPRVSKAGHVVFELPANELEGRRITGRTLIVPDDDDKVQLIRSKARGVVGVFKLCLDEAGHFESQEIEATTGIPSYDAKIENAMKGWAFKPYVVNSTPVPFCAVFTFIYSQR